MPEMSKAFTPKMMGDPTPRKKILDLARKITDVLPHKIKGVTSDDPEYWGLACILTDEMADIALQMKVRKTYKYEELRELCKEVAPDESKFKENLEKMCRIGILEYNYGDHYDDNGPTKEERIRQYLLPMFVPGSAEFTNMVKSQLDEHPELAMFFERMTFIPLEKITAMVPPGGAGIGMHVIPVEKAISMENKSLKIEHISHWLKKYEGHLGVGICSCRYGRSKLGEGCGDSCEDWCIGVGDMADYLRETGKGHDITYEQAMEILQRAEDNGFVHQITNIDGEDKIFAICNCNVNICNALRTSQLFNTPNMSRSAYTAKVEKEKCVACGKCVEHCPAGAVKLGQKLCTKNGEIKYPKHELPDYLSWGKDKWDENYRDNNRINCYETGTAPCKTHCPAHIAIQGYLRLAAMGKYQEALELIKKDNPFPAICGRVCNKLCEENCTRGTIDQPVAIDDVKRFIAEQDLNAATRFIPKKIIPSNEGLWKEKIAIVGAGPAGLSCAYFLALKGYLPVVYEKNAFPGGMLRYGIPSYKLENDLIDAEIDVLKQLGVEIKCGVEVGKDVTIEQLKAQGFKAFYIAIGCQGGKLPGVANEDASNVETAVTFLHKAAEDKERQLNGNVVVIGGGNVAYDCARTAKRFGASKVTIVCLEDKDHMLASKVEIAEANEEGIELITSFGVKEFVAENHEVKKIVIKKCLSTIDPVTKKFCPKYDENEIQEMDANFVITAVGQTIVWGDLLKGSKVTLRCNGYPIADKLTYQTSDPCIFVGGDVYHGPKFAINAIETGHQAAESLHRYVQPGSDLRIGRNRREFISLDKTNLVIDPDSYDHAGRQEADKFVEIDPKKSFKDLSKTLTEEQVKKEVRRCLGCGASVVDENKCIGCGVCTTKCKFDAIHLVRDHPECSKLVKSEDKFKYILPYMVKRGIKILFKPKTAGEKLSQKKHKEYKKNLKRAAKAVKKI